MMIPWFGLGPLLARFRERFPGGRGKERRMLHAVETFATMDGGRLDYLLFLPQGLRNRETETRTRRPLILFLHGAGERGDEPTLVLRQGLPKHVEGHPEFSFIVVSPQCSRQATWHGLMDALVGLLDELSARLDVDEDRVYLTGVSMGGAGAWHLAALRPERFAALAPICGYGVEAMGFPELVCALRDMPVWTFHGARDEIVPPRETRLLVAALEACGGNVRFTLYPDADHDSWTRTYDNPELYDWFLSHSRLSRRA